MIRYLFFNETGAGLTVTVADKPMTDDRRQLCDITAVDAGSFSCLWGMVQARHLTLAHTGTDTAEGIRVPFQAYAAEDGGHVIRYDTSQINKLVSLFALIKAWVEFQGCPGFDLKVLY